MSSPPLASSSRHLLAPVKSNWWLPLALLSLLPLAYWIEARHTFAHITWDPFWARVLLLLGINITLAVSLQLINGIAGQFSLGHAGFMGVGAYLGAYAVKTHGVRFDADNSPLDWSLPNAAHPGGVLFFFLNLLLLISATSLLLYGLYRLVLLLGKLHKSIPTSILWALVIWLAFDILTKSDIEGVATYHLGAIHTISFAANALATSYDFLAAHTAALANTFTKILPDPARKPATMLLSLLGGGTMAAIVGFVVGLPTLRLRGDYLAIATLGVAELIRTTFTNIPLFGSATGLISIPTYAADADADPETGIRTAYILPWIWGVALLTTLIVWRLQHSPKGRAMQCLREDEIAARAVGIDVTAHKVLAFVVGAFFAGVAGALYAHYDGYINPPQFALTRSTELVVMVTLGGLGSVPGTLLATFLLTLLQPTLQSAKSLAPSWMPHQAISIAEFLNQYRLVLYALLLIFAMLARSRGWLTFFKKRSNA